MARRRNEFPTHDRKPLDESANGQKWWTLEGREQQATAWSWLDRRREEQRGYETLDLIHEAMYEGRPIGRRFASTAAMDFLAHQRTSPSTLNVMQSLVDASGSRLARRRPMPVISGNNASYTEKQYAQRASRVFRTKMGAPHIERMRPLALRDAQVRGDGVFKVERRGGDVDVRRIPRASITLDEFETLNNCLRTAAHHELVQRDELIVRFPKQAKRIAALPIGQRHLYSAFDYDPQKRTDLVELLHVYRLPTSPGADDGFYAMCVRDLGEPLDACARPCPRLPFPGMQWTPPMRGYRGQGLIQQMAAHQHKVNELWREYQDALYWASGVKLLVPRGSGLNKEHMRARHPIIVEFDGGQPQFLPPNPGSQQAMEAIRWLVQQMYELSGISQASAASRNPLGPNASGKALDTMYDIESDRFSYMELQYAMLAVDLGQCMLDEAQALAADKKELRERDVKLAQWIDEIKWERFDFDGGEYHLMLEPENFLPDSRAGKLDTVSDYGKAGLISDPLMLLSLFDEPDIAAANRTLLGPVRRMQKLAEMLADASVPLEECMPTPYVLQPPGFAKKFIEGELDNMFAEGASDEDQGRFRWFLEMLEGVQAQSDAASATPPPMGAPGMPPPGASPGAGAASPTPLPPPMPGNGMGGLDAQAAAGMPPPPIMLPPNAALPQGVLQ